jgi:hypothetical protein
MYFVTKIEVQTQSRKKTYENDNIQMHVHYLQDQIYGNLFCSSGRSAPKFCY